MTKQAARWILFTLNLSLLIDYEWVRTHCFWLLYWVFCCYLRGQIEIWLNHWFFFIKYALVYGFSSCRIFTLNLKHKSALFLITRANKITLKEDNITHIWLDIWMLVMKSSIASELIEWQPYTIIHLRGDNLLLVLTICL